MPQKRDAFVRTTSTACEIADCCVPQEHNQQPTDSARDWSFLGRRVLAEALRRTTDELARRQTAALAAREAREVTRAQAGVFGVRATPETESNTEQRSAASPEGRA